ncbi:MAG: hypothetical protein PHW74_13640 [Desulfobacca sp.]|nr:hypothetical protein [Desulfobacca sp.]
MTDIASPGHKLGQMLGNFLEEFFYIDLVRLCNKHGFYFDRKGPRPGVRGSKQGVIWKDKDGNKHNLDYVIEKDGSANDQGKPIAFIELAWRRYTKHSRNKTGEIEGALLHLRDTYPSCQFLGAILAGEYTEGGKNQLVSHNINLIHIPFSVLATCFISKGVDLSYPEKAPSSVKAAIVEHWEALSQNDISDIEICLRNSIKEEYLLFRQKLERALLRKVLSLRILTLYGNELVFSSIQEAISAISELQEDQPNDLRFIKFEILLRFTDGDKIDCTFHTKEETLRFLNIFS